MKKKELIYKLIRSVYLSEPGIDAIVKSSRATYIMDGNSIHENEGIEEAKKYLYTEEFLERFYHHLKPLKLKDLEFLLDFYESESLKKFNEVFPVQFFFSEAVKEIKKRSK